MRDEMTNLCVALLLCAVLSACDRTAHTNSPATLTALLEMAPANVATVAIARMNLLCAQGLGGADCVDLDAADGQLDAWADQVRTETDRHSYRFNRNPAEFEGSEGFFKLLMLGVVLAEDYRVRYHPELRAGLQGADAQDGFFADPQAVFLSGLLGDERQGTCSSVPVLYLAVGRRLRYPLRLVTTKGHLFVRWEGQGERFNLEVTGKGLNRFPDDYYRHWPFEVSDQEVEAEGYPRSLTPREELAVFMSIRAMCLREAGLLKEAGEVFDVAARLAPGVASYRMMAGRCREERGVPWTAQTIGGEL
jgi:hypothetical protein